MQAVLTQTTGASCSGTSSHIGNACRKFQGFYFFCDENEMFGSFTDYCKYFFFYSILVQMYLLSMIANLSCF